jgi:hypothetical protein
MPLVSKRCPKLGEGVCFGVGVRTGPVDLAGEWHTDIVPCPAVIIGKSSRRKFHAFAGAKAGGIRFRGRAKVGALLLIAGRLCLVSGSAMVEPPQRATSCLPADSAIKIATAFRFRTVLRSLVRNRTDSWILPLLALQIRPMRDEIEEGNSENSQIGLRVRPAARRVWLPPGVSRRISESPKPREDCADWGRFSDPAGDIV